VFLTTFKYVLLLLPTMQTIVARTIIEMLGAPKEYIADTLKKYVAKIKKEGLEVNTEHYAEPKEAGRFFSVFVELEARFKDYKQLLDFCFDSMPSSVEIIEPAELTFDSGYVNDFLNDMQARLHEIDLIVKNTRAEKDVLDKNAMNVLRNFIRHLIKQGHHSIEEISKLSGIKQKDLQAILDKMVSNNMLAKEENAYTIP